MQRLFVRMADGRLYAADAAVSQNALGEAQKNFRGLSCSFAGDAYAVYPETLLFDSEALSLPVLKPAQINLFAAQSGTGLEDLLGAFGYTAYTDFYNEQDGTVRVFLDDTSTLRLNASGLVQYASTDGSATVSYTHLLRRCASATAPNTFAPRHGRSRPVRSIWKLSGTWITLTLKPSCCA